ncbi:MAG: aromatic aminobenezylarsenical efflux permease ArsG family transporter [Bacteroidales bacterium]|nr:aromatic aminobenezylarsenical efflux permease ArsG family transporter [Bacteroidales bacterium]MDY0215916.1 aromatic aminobenezylarsenical efflux permease ArsG family transporter [Bacteroidales bacterium]
MNFLQDLANHSEYGILIALALGLMTAISPCPLATNITAIGFISKNLENKKRVFLSGVFYTLGRVFSYTTIGVILYFGASQFQIQKLFQAWGEKLLGPILIMIGLFMLDIVKIKFPGFNFSEKISKQKGQSYWSSFLLGVVFALAFCPYSGVLYFGGLIPLTIASPYGLFLPIIFALATALPVIIFAWLIAFTLGSVGTLYNKIKVFEKWFRRIVSILFIVIGIYYVLIFFF